MIVRCAYCARNLHSSEDKFEIVHKDVAICDSCAKQLDPSNIK